MNLKQNTHAKQNTLRHPRFDVNFGPQSNAEHRWTIYVYNLELLQRWKKRETWLPCCENVKRYAIYQETACGNRACTDDPKREALDAPSWFLDMHRPCRLRRHAFRSESQIWASDFFTVVASGTSSAEKKRRNFDILRDSVRKRWTKIWNKIWHILLI